MVCRKVSFVLQFGKCLIPDVFVDGVLVGIGRYRTSMIKELNSVFLPLLLYPVVPIYGMTIGEREIYEVLYSQIEELYKAMGQFIEREKAPFQCKIKGYGEYDVSMSKDVGL